MPGPAPKPTTLKIVGGNPGKRGLNKQEPDPPALLDLSAPEWLPEPARRVWDELAPEQAAAKMLTAVDREEFAKYVLTCWQIRVYAEEVADQPVSTTSQGNEYLNPRAAYLAMMLKASKSLAEQFGRTPAARSRVMVQPQGDLFGGDGFGDFARRRPGAA